MTREHLQWFSALRSVLIEKHNWTWEQVKEVTFSQISYTQHLTPEKAARVVDQDFGDH